MKIYHLFKHVGIPIKTKPPKPPQTLALWGSDPTSLPASAKCSQRSRGRGVPRMKCGCAPPSAVLEHPALPGAGFNQALEAAKQPASHNPLLFFSTSPKASVLESLEMTASSACQHQQDARINGIAKTDSDTGNEGLTRGVLRRTLPDICFELQAKIDAFLSEQTDDAVLRNVQSQVRVSMDVIQEALRRYG